MPNRILRDWTDSDRVDGISAESERFFVRLIMKADDFGRYFADPKRLKAFLFPLKDSLRETDCSRWLAECEKAGLIRCYDVAGKRYLEMQRFGQRLRNMRNTHPEPPIPRPDANPPQVAASGGGSRPESESESESKQKRIEVRRLAAARLEKLFGRTEIDTWTYLEDSTLSELMRRPNFGNELTGIESFRAKNPEFFPQSLASLLSKWSETLDRARNYVGKKVSAGPLIAEVRELVKEKFGDDPRAANWAASFHGHWSDLKRNWSRNGRPIDWKVELSAQCVKWRGA